MATAPPPRLVAGSKERKPPESLAARLREPGRAPERGRPEAAIRGRAPLATPDAQSAAGARAGTGARARGRPSRRRWDHRIREVRSRPGGRGSGASARSPAARRGACARPSDSATSNQVTASRGSSVSSERRVGSRRSRPSGASMRPVARARPAANEREVAPLDLALADRGLQGGESALRAGYDEQPGRIAVEAMDDARALRVVAALRSQRQQLRSERPRRSSPRRDGP